jgi:ribosomal protein S12 methylthiotransferase
MKSFHITTLGCPKNRVDSDLLTGLLQHKAFTFTDCPEQADILFINTCGFIEAAKEESLQAIFEALALKKKYPDKKVMAIGCLSERYGRTLRSEIPELDGVFGTEAYTSIFASLQKNLPDTKGFPILRNIAKPIHYTYLKISEGCNRHCTFCAIPFMRGKFRSRSMESIYIEAKYLADKGVRELILVSQDSSSYGIDLYGEQYITQLLEKLAGLATFDWIRVLYWYPLHFPMRFIELIEQYSSIIPYVDIPLQHCSNRILKRMKRGDTYDQLISLIETMRSRVPDIVLRTSFISGFPGETMEDFQMLNEFIKKIRFDHIGIFNYSEEEGTEAFNFKPKISKRAASKRTAQLMETQRKISEEKNQNLIGTQQEVLIDYYDEDMHYYTGRTFRDAPEIDNEVLITSAGFKEDLIGTFQNVRINDCSEYELYGNFIDKTQAHI